MTAPWNAHVDGCDDCRPWPSSDELRDASMYVMLAPYRARLDAIEAEIAKTRRGRAGLRLAKTWQRLRHRHSA